MGGMMEMELPALEEGALDAAGVTALFADYQAHTQVFEVMSKGAARGRARDGGLLELLPALLSGELRGLQVRYHYQGVEWWDTILRAPAGFKVVRMKQDFGQPQS